MSEPGHGTAPHLVESLAKIAKKHRVARKLVVVPSAVIGRELIRKVAVDHGGWIGFEVTTPRPLALRLARSEMERGGLTLLDAFEERAMLDHAVDAAMTAEGGPFGRLAEGIGFREGVHDAVRALRLAGIGPEALDAARLPDWKKRLFLLHVLQRYERLLVERGRADSATVFDHAITALEGAGSMPDALDAELVLLGPGLRRGGLPGRFVTELAGRGGRVLETDAVAGLHPPDSILWGRRGVPSAGSTLFDPSAEPPDGASLSIDLFRASSVHEEIRHVLRTAADRGLVWDQVEIVTPDPATYGSAVHAITTELGIPATYAVGLPVDRTRTGRVVRAYLDWIEEGFQADPMRRLLESGDLRPRRSTFGTGPGPLARRFRLLRIGWGRKRYRTQLLDALAAVEELPKSRFESDEDHQRRMDRQRDQLRALRSIFFPALKATPTVPDRMDERGRRVSPSEVALGLLAFLKRVPKGSGPDVEARDEVIRILDRVAVTQQRRTEFRAAVAILRGYLAIRVRGGREGEGDEESVSPWVSEGGAVHVSDLEHGGFTGRPATFLVGFDADRVPGPRAQDAVLLDADRRILGGDLLTSGEVADERQFALAALFARLRGTVTLSYAAWRVAEARTIGPSPVLLQALRLSRRDPALTFDDLHEAVGRVVAPVPREGTTVLDADDAWLRRVGDGPTLRRGQQAVRRGYERLDAGLAGAEARKGLPGPAHGVVAARAEFDPRDSQAHVLSASRLEDLGRCPRKYLHSTVLRLRPPRDPEYDPERWLNALDRGTLLHRVYERTLRRAREDGVRFPSRDFETLAAETLDEGIERFKIELPVPGEGALSREIASLHQDVRSFVRLVREHGAAWQELELTFGGDGHEPVGLDVEGGTILVRGAIDRVDTDLGGVRVVDYKTGAARAYAADTKSFNGGRRLQHAVYARVAETLGLGDVVGGQYQHPSRRGQNRVASFAIGELSRFEELAGHLVAGAAAGHFVPTESEDDCMFCDFAAVCRVTRDAWGDISSPLATWAEEQLKWPMSDAIVWLKETREFEQ